MASADHDPVRYLQGVLAVQAQRWAELQDREDEWQAELAKARSRWGLAWSQVFDLGLSSAQDARQDLADQYAPLLWVEEPLLWEGCD